MNQDAILSFSTPLSETRHLVVTPAPVLELTYAYYFLLKRLDRDRDSNLPWVKQLREHPSEALAGLRTVWRKREMENLGYELFVLACGLGYATDPKPNRFLSDFPTLPGRILDGLEEITDAGLAGAVKLKESKAERDETNRRLRGHFEVLSEPAAAVEMQQALSALWAHLEPAWEREGRSVSETACSMLENEIAAKGDLLAALPSHHFVQFEDSAAALRERQRSGKIIVVPLFFASHGGFSMDIGGIDYLGYGVHAESLFREQQSELADLAGRLKAFSDPTRLLLLVLIGRLTQFPLTVGDLAKQAGVSQPTASGHLRILREMGLVDVVKKGNRSFYRLVEGHARATMDELQRVLLG
ncbi:MAG TPA: metalloregulator ArsR/SmtB family transcription factor [Trueperaceae bacterium]|nr:metalloregulator ArsR/SmtB family transcription factor [Trueperaceae bacterium]